MKSLQKWLNIRHLIIVGMIFPFLLLLLVGGLQWKSLSDFNIAREEVNHTRIILLKLESFASCMKDAETGQRGFLLTHKDSYLNPYPDSSACSSDQIQTLRHLLANNASQQTNLDRLESLRNTKLTELAQTITLEQRGDHAGALLIVNSDLGKKTMDEIRSTVSVMQDAETKSLLQREDAYQQKLRINSELSLLLTALGLFFVAAIILLLRRLERMQEMIKICSWSKLIEYEGEWLSIEDYLIRRFGATITHGMSDGEAKKFLDLINEQKQKEPA